MDRLRNLEEGNTMAFTPVSFVKKIWKDATSGGTPITAKELNRMEDGINDCATQLKNLVDSVSPLKTFFVGDKSSVTLSFASANHSAAFLIIDNNGAPSAIFLNCMDSTSKILAGQSLNITFPSKTTAAIKAPAWSFGVVMSPTGDDCSISVA